MPQGRLHILYFIHDLAPFGAQRVALHTARALDTEKFRVTVCSFGGDETLAPEFAKSGAEVVLLRAKRFLDLSAWLRLAALLFRTRPGIIQTNLAELSIPVRLLSPFLPGMLITHNVQNPFSCEDWYWRILNRATLRLCGAVIFCSRSIMEEAALCPKLFSGKLFVVQNGISLEPASASECQALRKELGVGKNEKVIGCVGRLTGQKGQDVLIEAVARLKNEKRNLRLLLAGDGETSEELRAQVRRLGLEREVNFLGRRADIARVLSACDIYAAPSRWEGLNIALGEAMFSGLPCAASEIPGHADILRDGMTGLAVPPEDAGALAGAISRLLDRPDEAEKMANAASSMIRADFTTAKMAEKFEKIYLDLEGKC